MMVSRHGYRVLWPFACTVIHSGAIKSDVTQTSTGERGIHVHLPLSFSLSLCFLSAFFLLKLFFPCFFQFLHAALCECIRDRAETSRKKRNSRSTSTKFFDVRETCALSWFDIRRLKPYIISLSLWSMKFLSVVNIIRRLKILKRNVLNFYRRSLKWFFKIFFTAREWFGAFGNFGINKKTKLKGKKFDGVEVLCKCVIYNVSVAIGLCQRIIYL